MRFGVLNLFSCTRSLLYRISVKLITSDNLKSECFVKGGKNATRTPFTHVNCYCLML